MSDLISIIIPTFNRAHLIGETLDSILAQTYQNWECIIVDDGSTDTTEELIATYIAADSRFQFFHRPSDRPKGGNACRNYGFEKSKGVFIKWFDSDDLMKPEFLSIQYQTLLVSPELDFCAAFCEVFPSNENHQFLNPLVTENSDDLLFDLLYERIFFLTPAPLWRNSFLVHKKLFDEQLFRGQEADFNFRRLLEGARFRYTSDILFMIRRGHESIESTAKSDIKSFESRITYYNNYFIAVDGITGNIHLKEQAKKYIVSRQAALLCNLYCSKNKTIYFSQVLLNISKCNISYLRKTFLRFSIRILRHSGRGYRLIKFANVIIQ